MSRIRIQMMSVCFTGILSGLTAQAVTTVSIGSVRQIPPTAIGTNGTMARDQFSGGTTDQWLNPQHVGDLIESGINVLRYPGGTYGNSFDWLEGRLRRKPLARFNFPPEQTKPASDAMDGKMLWMLNVITDTMTNVTNALGIARDQGVEVKYVEMGNEYYFRIFDPTSDNYEANYIYPEGVTNGWETGTDYGEDMNGWIAAVKSEFPDAICSVPLTRNVVSDSRQNEWNWDVTTACTNYDAVTIHLYMGSGIDLGYQETLDVAEQTEQWNYFVHDTNAVQTVMGMPKAAWTDRLRNPSLYLPPDKPVWYTEFGINTRPFTFTGTWADGLAEFALREALMAHESAEIFAEQQYTDLHHGGPDSFVKIKIDVGQDLTTTLGDLTAQGHMVRALATVSRDKEIIAPLVFGNAHMVSPPGGGAYSALIGTLFSDAFESSVILANISDQAQEIETTRLGPVGADVTVITAEHFYTFVVNDSDLTYSNFTMESTLELPPFSLCTITGLKRSIATPEMQFTPKFDAARVTVYASDDMIYTNDLLSYVSDQNSEETLSFSLTGINPPWVSDQGVDGLVISGPEAGLGSYEVFVRVEDSAGLTDYVTLDIEVIDGSLNSDADPLSNNEEILLYTNPFLADTDGDGVSDSDDKYPLDPPVQMPYLDIPDFGTISPAADAYVRSGNSFFGDQSDVNFGEEPTLVAKDAGTDESESYLAFTLETDSLEEVLLHLYVINDPVRQKDTIHVYAVADSSWGETNLTWSTRPARGAEITSQYFDETYDGWATFDLSDHITGPGTYVVALAAEAYNKGVTFSSREGANPPYLNITTSPLRVDSDGDLLPDDYEVLHGFSPSVGGDDASDPDNDGLDTLLEYAIGQDPNQPLSGERGMYIESGDSGEIRLLLNERTNLREQGLDLILEHSMDLVSWTRINDYNFTPANLTLDAATAEVITDDYGRIERRRCDLSGPNRNGFFRVRLVPYAE